MSDIPGNQPVYTMQIASSLTGLHPQTIRKYEKEGLIPPPARSHSLRLFSNDDIARLKLIKRLSDDGHNVAGLWSLLQILEIAQNNDYELQERLKKITEILPL